MAYRIVVNNLRALSAQESQLLLREMDALRAEMDDVRSKFASLLAKLDADTGVADTNYASTLALAAAQFKAT